jgi:hypothetical protein
MHINILPNICLGFKNASILTEYPASIATQNHLELDFLLLEIPLLQEQLAPY